MTPTIPPITKAALAVFVIFFGLWVVHIGERFVEAKIANDSAIARDTKRAADALERIAGPIR